MGARDFQTNTIPGRLPCSGHPRGGWLSSSDGLQRDVTHCVGVSALAPRDSQEGAYGRGHQRVHRSDRSRFRIRGRCEPTGTHQVGLRLRGPVSRWADAAVRRPLYRAPTGGRHHPGRPVPRPRHHHGGPAARRAGGLRGWRGRTGVPLRDQRVPAGRRRHQAGPRGLSAP